MTPHTLTIGAGLGGICLLNTKTALRQRVYDAADSVGCGKFVPAQPARTTVLRECMKQVADDKYGRMRKKPITVRQIDDTSSFEAVRVVPGQTKNDYQFLYSATIDQNWGVSILEYTTDGPVGYSLLAPLDQSVATMRDYLPGPVISQVVVKMLRRWGATSLKDDGGAWFLCGQHLDDYRAFASQVRGNGDGPKFTVTQFEIASDPDTVAHVLDCLHNEITAGLKEIMDDVLEATGGMADRSIACRVEKANKFLSKVQQYESLLGRPLPELTDAIEQTKNAVAVNRLLATSA